MATGSTWTCVVHYRFVTNDADSEIIYVDEPAATLVTNGGDVTLPQFLVTLEQP